MKAWAKSLSRINEIFGYGRRARRRQLKDDNSSMRGAIAPLFGGAFVARLFALTARRHEPLRAGLCEKCEKHRRPDCDQ